MDAAARQALVEYGRTIIHDGWEAGEILVRRNAAGFESFEKWARALAIVLRCKELLVRARGEAS